MSLRFQMQMYYSLAVNVSIPGALVQPLLSIKKEGLVPSRPSCEGKYMYFLYDIYDKRLSIDYL